MWSWDHIYMEILKEGNETKCNCGRQKEISFKPELNRTTILDF